MPKSQIRKPGKPQSLSSVIPIAKAGGRDAFTPMNFKVPEQFHREFKLYAVQNGMSMVDLLQQSFNVLKENRKHQPAGGQSPHIP